MQGRTKGIFEDVFVLSVIGLLAWGGYSFFFLEDETSPSKTPLTLSQNLQKQETNLKPSIIEEEPIQKEKIQIDIQEIQEIQKLEKKTETLSNKIEENQNLNEKVILKDERIEIKEEIAKQSVDLKILQKFLVETKQKIKDSIVVDTKNNQKKINLSIRVTVLKSGEYEQLIHTGGDVNIFKNNYENMVKLFPLEINEKIVAEFPRYLRYSFKFTQKEE